MTRLDGFSLVELLLAVAIALIVVGGAFELAGRAQRMFQAQPEASDMHQRTRVAVDALHRDLLMAGAGTYAGPALGALNFSIAPLLPFRAFGDSPDQARGLFFRSDVLSFMYVPATPSQTRLAESLAPGGLEPLIESLPNCPMAAPQHACGFDEGDRVLLFDESSNWDVYSVDRVFGGVMSLQRRGQPSPVRYPVGAAVAEIEAGSYSLKSDERSSTFQLVRYDGWSRELPIVDDVVGLSFRYFGSAAPPQLTGVPLDSESGPWTTYGPAPPPVLTARGGWPPGENCTFAVVDGIQTPRLSTLAIGSALVELTPALLTDGPWCPDALSPNRFDADLLRVRRVQVSLRVQSALASLRGPAGPLFTRGGTAQAGESYLPDIAATFDVAPRNMNLGR